MYQEIPEEQFEKHRNSCCQEHGCKYEEKGCPVTLRLIMQNTECTKCEKEHDLNTVVIEVLHDSKAFPIDLSNGRTAYYEKGRILIKDENANTIYLGHDVNKAMRILRDGTKN